MTRPDSMTRPRWVTLTHSRDDSLWSGVYIAVFALLALTVIALGRHWDFESWMSGALTSVIGGGWTTLVQVRRNRRIDAIVRRSKELR